jgi:hypothetical protein
MSKDPSNHSNGKILKLFWISVFVVGLGAGLCVGICRFSSDSSLTSTRFLDQCNEQTYVQNDDSYFDAIWISKWTSGGCPCLPIQIENKMIFALIDLGFRGSFSIDSTFLEEVEEKTLLGSRVMYGFHGVPFRENVFSIPNIRIGQRVFELSQVQEEEKEPCTQVAFVKDGGIPSAAPPGKIGWELFQNTNLLLDLKNEKIAFCDALSTLKKQGYAIEQFVQIPMIIDRGLIEIDIEIDSRPIRCVLDTGSTFNILNIENGPNRTMQELLWSPENFHITNTLKIAEEKFDQMTFRQMAVRLPIHIDAILGMDFFSKYIVFLDFTNNLAYFSH